MRALSLILIPAFAAIAVAKSEGPSIYPSAKAPDLSVKRWVKGVPVTALPEHGIAVVEFWATWCGPCKMSIPHLTEVAHKHKDVVFIGTSIWEDDSAKIDSFVKEMGDKMDYNVAYSSNQEGMAKTWMHDSGSNGIPTAFIVKDRVIQWIGHPMEMEKPLEDVLANKNDLAKAKLDYVQAVSAQMKEMEVQGKLGAIDKKFWGGDKKGAKADLALIKKDNPENEAIKGIENEWLGAEDEAKFLKFIDDQLAASQIQNVFDPLMSLVSHKETVKVADKAAIKLYEKGGADVNAYYVSYTIFKQSKDQAMVKKSAKKLLELIDKNKMDVGEMHKQLEADSKN